MNEYSDNAGGLIERKILAYTYSPRISSPTTTKKKGKNEQD